MTSDEEKMKRYRPEDWDRDIGYWYAKGTLSSQDIPSIVAYFQERYPDDPNRYENCERLWGAVAFLETNLPELIKAGAAKPRAAGTALPMGLKSALYRLFISLPVATLRGRIDVALVLRLTKEQKDWNEDRT